MHRMQGNAEGSRLPFLVVDDDQVLCGEMGRILSAFSDVVLTESLAGAHHALDTIHALAGAVIDVLLQPGNGIDIVDRLQVEHPGLTTLVITGDLVPERINDACLRGVEFLAKPFTRAVLQAWAARAVEAWGRSAPACAFPGDLPEDLRRLAARAVAASTDVGRAQGTYAEHLGALARAASGRRLASRSATAACAEAIGVSRQVLQAAGAVGARVAEPVFQDLFSRRNCQGRHITPSHLVAVSGLPNSTRAEVIERIFSEGLGVHDVRSLVSQLRQSPSAKRRNK
jgi:ActR/RegA family two-component response regulator